MTSLAGRTALQLLALVLAWQTAATNITQRTTVYRRDQFDVEYYASLGDSFASGPSAGDDFVSPNPCRRYTDAMGPRLSRAPEIQGPKPMPKFDFIACSGSVTKHIWQDPARGSSGDEESGKPTKPQASELGLYPDMVTLSIGGNDVGFTDLLDRCVYRFKQVGCGGCDGDAFNDCSDDCQMAMSSLGDKIEAPEFRVGLTKSIEAIFKKTIATRLFITGYPRFWNENTEGCNVVSFKSFCNQNTVLPLIKKRRAGMNELTNRLNSKIKDIINNYQVPPHSQIIYVNVDPYFEGHRFCEEGVNEPSYRNPEIYFYPFEFWTGGTVMMDGTSVPSGDCQAIIDNGGDEGDYYACQMANAALESGPIDFSQLPNNVPGGDDQQFSISVLPDFAARIFHPTRLGFDAYKHAVIQSYQDAPPLPDRPGAPPAGKTLRVIPIGDSITQGFPSADENGYRKTFYDLAVGAGATVDMIGSGRGGNMEDPDEEGHNSLGIADIASRADSTLGQRPNVVLLHAGTNDMNSDEQASGAPGRLATLIDRIFEKCPDATILAALIIKSTVPGFQPRIDVFNRDIEAIFDARIAQGKHLIIVNMDAALSKSDLVDNLHPTDEGYRKMGRTWYNALTAANANGWINDPIPGNAPPGKEFCPGKPVWLPNGEIANGALLGPNFGMGRDCVDVPQDTQGSLQCACTPEVGGLTTVVLPPPTGRCSDLTTIGPHAVQFADLNGDGRAEYLWIAPSGVVTAFHNSGGPGGPDAAKVNWIPKGTIASGAGAIRGQIHFADINGDGRTEFLIVGANSSVEAYVNLGWDTMNGWLPNGIIASGHPNADGEGVRFADLDGDGRAEYIWISPTGSVGAYLNDGKAPDNGPNAAKVQWVPMGELLPGAPGSRRSDIVFADVNGDGRADYLWIDRGTGAVKAWLNEPSGDRLRPNWNNIGLIASGPGDGSGGHGIQFADLNGDGRAEYLNVDALTSAVDAWVSGC